MKYLKIILVLILLNCSPKVVETQTVRENNIEQWSEGEVIMFNLINDYNPTGLIPNKSIREECQKRIKFLSDNNLVSHEGIGVAIIALKEKGFNGIIEVIAYKYSSPESAFMALQNSDSHNNALLKERSKYIGVSIEGDYYLILFAY